MKAEGEIKWCPRCGERRPVTDFYRNASTVDGLQVWCKGCLYESQQEIKRRNRVKPPRKSAEIAIARIKDYARAVFTDAETGVLLPYGPKEAVLAIMEIIQEEEMK